MGYYRNYRRPKPETVPVSEELTARLERVAVELKPHLTDWEQGFMESITEAYEKWNGLTVGQSRTFEKIEKSMTPIPSLPSLLGLRTLPRKNAKL